ncbi:MAG: transcription termination/antitermination protein NusG [Planctomycetota bacterium]
MPKHWFVIKAVSGREDKCREVIEYRIKSAGLGDQVEELLIPVEHVTEVKRGKRVTSKHKLYPGYIYVKMDPTQQVLETIRAVDGVTGFLGADPALPDRLTPEEAERIIKISTAATPDEQRAAIVQIPYEVGDKVRVREGTFAGMDGVVDEINPTKGSLRVLITVFGRQTPIELEVWQVEELS